MKTGFKAEKKRISKLPMKGVLETIIKTLFGSLQHGQIMPLKKEKLKYAGLPLDIEKSIYDLKM